MSAAPSSDNPAPQSPTNAWELVAPRLESIARHGSLAIIPGALGAVGILPTFFAVAAALAFSNPVAVAFATATAIVCGVGSAVAGVGAMLASRACQRDLEGVGDTLAAITVQQTGAGPTTAWQQSAPHMKEARQALRAKIICFSTTPFQLLGGGGLLCMAASSMTGLAFANNMVMGAGMLVLGVGGVFNTISALARNRKNMREIQRTLSAIPVQPLTPPTP